MDRIGIQRPNTDVQRADMVAALCAKGLANRITLSHDAACYLDMITDGLIDERVPQWNFTHIPTTIVPMLKERGVSDADIHQMTVR